MLQPSRPAVAPETTSCAKRHTFLHFYFLSPVVPYEENRLVNFAMTARVSEHLRDLLRLVVTYCAAQRRR